MPSPRQPFQSISEAVEIISHYHDTFNFPIQNRSIQRITADLISGNITRAFSGLPRSPKGVVAEWAGEEVDQLIRDLTQVKEQTEFDTLITKYAMSLIDFWDDTYQIPSRRIGWGPATKITNLLVKALHESNHFENQEVYKMMHVPFDLYTIKPLRFIINDLTEIRYGIFIHGNPTMKFVDTPNLYDLLQQSIRRLCDEAGSFPIVYEYLCWDEEH